MAYAYLTAIDLAKINGTDKEIGVIEENLNSAPELAMFPASVIDGISYSTLIRTAIPTGAFRKVNEGVEPTKSTYAQKFVQCFYYDGKLEIDVAVAQMCDQGEDYAKTLEATGHGMAYLQTIGKQIWYGTGTGGSANGFPGAVQIVDSSYVTDAGGTTAATGSSVYGVKLGDQFCKVVFGNKRVMSLGDWRVQTITRNSKELDTWKASMQGWIGAQWTNKHAVSRIKKLTADSGKGLTDTLLGSHLAKLPVGMQPDYWFMTQRSREQLRASRTATNPTGAPAPLPTDAFGIPIVVTDSLLNTEALTL